MNEIIVGAMRVLVRQLEDNVSFSVVSSSPSGKLRRSALDELALDAWGLLSLSVKLLNNPTTERLCPHLYLEGFEIPRGMRKWGPAAAELRRKLRSQEGRYGIPSLDDRSRLLRKEAITLGESTLWYAEGEERPWRLTNCNCSLRTLLEFAAIVISDNFTRRFDKRVWIPWLMLTPSSKFTGNYLVSETLVEPIAGWTVPFPLSEEEAPKSIGVAVFAEDTPTSGPTEQSDSPDEPPNASEGTLDNVVSLLYLPDGDTSSLGIGLVKVGEQYQLATITNENLEEDSTRYWGSTADRVLFPRFSDLVELFTTVVLGPEFSSYAVQVFPQENQTFHAWLPSGNKATRSQKDSWAAIQKSVQKSFSESHSDGAAASPPLLPRVGTICLRDTPPYGFSFSTGAQEDNPRWTKEELAKMALLVLSDPLNPSDRRAHAYGSVLEDAVGLWRKHSPEAGLDEVLPLQTKLPESGTPPMEVSSSTNKTLDAETEPEPVENSSVEATPLRIDSSETRPVAQRPLLVEVSQSGTDSDEPWDSITDPEVLVGSQLEKIKADFNELRCKLGTQ